MVVVYLAFTAVECMSTSVIRSLTEKTVKQLFECWRKPLDRGENALILAMPKMDRSYRIPEFTQTLGNSYDFHVISLVSEKIEDINDWNRYTTLHESGSKKKRCFLVSDAELLFQDSLYQAHSFLFYMSFGKAAICQELSAVYHCPLLRT